MTAEECIKYCEAVPSTKYPDRYDVDDRVGLSKKTLTVELCQSPLDCIPVPFGVIFDSFNCDCNNLTSLYNAPIEVHGDFSCSNNKLTTLDHLPKYIGKYLFCRNNPFQNLNALKDVTIKGHISLLGTEENQLNFWIRALYNTNLDALEYHYDKHRYKSIFNKELENYIMNVLEDIIKIKTMKNHLNL